MFKKFYLYVIKSHFLLGAQNAWMMRFEKAYGKLTDLMKEEYDIHVKAELGLSHMLDRDVQRYAQNYFDAFHGVSYFLTSGTKRDATSPKKYVDLLGRISTTLFSRKWEIHQELMNHLLRLESFIHQHGKKLDQKNSEIADLKSQIQSLMKKHETVDLDSFSGGAGAGRVVGAASSRTPRKKLHSRSSRAERVEYLAAPSPTQPLF